jgi:hypothetical protein
LRPDKKLHAPVAIGVPFSSFLTSLRLLVRYLPPATTRRTGGKKKGKEGRRKRGEGREKIEGEGKGEDRRKEVGYKLNSTI